MFEGNIVALVTPMLENGDIDFDSLENLVRWHIEQGSHGLVVCGTTGEASALSNQEYQQVIAAVVKRVNKAIPVIAGVGAPSTQKALELLELVKPLDVDGVLTVTPYYVKPTQAGLIEHFKAIARNTSLPIMLYNVPSRTGVDLMPSTVEKLSHIDNIVAIKEATGDIERVTDILALTSGQFTVFSGDDETFQRAMERGAKGVISVTSNVFPKEMSDICQSTLKNDIEYARKLNAQLSAFHEKLFVESNPTPVKWILSKRGLIKNVLRLPLLPLSEQGQAVVAPLLDAESKEQISA